MRSLLFAASLCLPVASRAQSLDLTINEYGLSIGDSRRVRGVRLNFRDGNLVQVDGVNITIWAPYSPARGTVNGLALGLPVTGARDIHGAGVGIFGVGTERDFSGIGVAGLGLGAGGDMRGIMVGGLGVGSGGQVRGLAIGGLGVGSGGGVSGITLAGLGIGSGGDLRGLSIAGLGVGGGGDVRGITIAGLGVGGGGDMTGLQVGGIGLGGGGDVTGISIAGVAIGAGGTLRGIAVGGIGVGASRIRALVVASTAGGHDVAGGVLAPFYFRIESDNDGDLGRVKGISISAFNHIKGEQFGLSIGLLNYAWELNGWQIGVLNYAASNPKGLRLLPLFNRAW